MERWERELERLKGVDAPPHLRSRVDAGPTGDGMPSGPNRSQRIAAGLVALVVVVGAGALLASAFRRDEAIPIAPVTGEAVITLTAAPNQALGTLSYDGVTITAPTGSYCWTQEQIDTGTGEPVSAMSCRDIAEPQPFAPEDFLDVPRGTPFVLENEDGADPVDITVTAGDTPLLVRFGDPIDVDALADLEAGDHVLTVTAGWEGRGEHVTFWFPLRIVETSTAAATLELTESGAFLTYGDQRLRGVETDEFPAEERDELPQTWLGIGSFDRLVVVEPGTPIEFVEGGWDWVVIRPQPPYENRFGSEPGPVVLTVDVGFGPRAYQYEFGVLVEGDEPYTLRVPDLVGLGDQEAFSLLNEVGLSADVAFLETGVDDPWRVVTIEPPPGTAVHLGDRIRVVIDTVIDPLPPGAVDDVGCDETAAFGGPRLRIQPSGEAYVRGNTVGVSEGDEVVPSENRSDFEGVWHVVRDDAVVAVIDYESLDGVACVGSGVGGV
jgi:hypothetical protein